MNYTEQVIIYTTDKYTFCFPTKLQSSVIQQHTLSSK